MIFPTALTRIPSSSMDAIMVSGIMKERKLEHPTIQLTVSHQYSTSQRWHKTIILPFSFHHVACTDDRQSASLPCVSDLLSIITMHHIYCSKL